MATANATAASKVQETVSEEALDIPKEEMAHHAVKLLLDRIHNGHNSAARIELPCKLLVRESCSISPH